MGAKARDPHTERGPRRRAPLRILCILVWISAVTSWVYLVPVRPIALWAGGLTIVSIALALALGAVIRFATRPSPHGKPASVPAAKPPKSAAA